MEFLLTYSYKTKSIFNVYNHKHTIYHNHTKSQTPQPTHTIVNHVQSTNSNTDIKPLMPILTLSPYINVDWQQQQLHIYFP